VLVNGVLYHTSDSHLSITANNHWSLQIPPANAMPEGHYDVTAVVSDAVGNISTDPSSGELLIDTTAPDIATVISQLTNDSAPIVTGFANPGPGETLTVTIDGVTYTGSYDILVSVIDPAGNRTDSTGNLLIDTTDPTIDVDAVGDDKTVTPLLTGSTDQPDGSIVSVLNADGEPVCNATVLNGDWQCQPDSPLNFGANALLATIADAAGNVAQFQFDVAVDTDFDGDGIDNLAEGTSDYDGDGIADLYDLDTDNDGIPDTVEGNKDTDGDGIPDYRDRDADNDGIADVVEAGASDQDVNFILDTLVDTDSNGLADTVQSSPLPVTDTDFDGIPNYLDVDSDQDGIPDLVELGGTDSDNDGRIDNAQDNNNDGIDDAALLLPFLLLYSDDDNTADYLDIDSDQDGTYDLVEAGGNDVDNDGIVDSMKDLDQDGIPDSVDTTYTFGEDIDSDGIDDRMDASQLALLDDAVTVSDNIGTPDSGRATPPLNDAGTAVNSPVNDSAVTDRTVTDSDGDGIADRFDPDANGDGYADDKIMLLAIGMALPDEDNNGTPDFQQPNSPTIYTGLQGHAGCSLNGRESRDPLLPLLLVLAILGIAQRSCSQPSGRQRFDRRSTVLSDVV